MMTPRNAWEFFFGAAFAVEKRCVRRSDTPHSVGWAFWFGGSGGRCAPGQPQGKVGHAVGMGEKMFFLFAQMGLGPVHTAFPHLPYQTARASWRAQPSKTIAAHLPVSGGCAQRACGTLRQQSQRRGWGGAVSSQRGMRETAPEQRGGMGPCVPQNGHTYYGKRGAVRTPAN